MIESANWFTGIAKRVAAAVLIAAAAAFFVDGSIALGIAAGGAWNLVNLWCLNRLLGSWLGPSPSTRRAVGWLLIKFPLLYMTAFLLLARAAVSLVGFSVGFSLVLIVALVLLVARSRSLMTPAASRR